MTHWNFLTIFGLTGQGLFSARFLVQWLTSEKHKRSTIPMAFWYLSIAGGLTLLIYAIERHDLVFSIGQCFGLIVYVRNLQLQRAQTAEAKVESRA